MNVGRVFAVVCVCVFLPGCMAKLDPLVDAPSLSPVGSGLSEGETTGSIEDVYQERTRDDGDWRGGPADYFGDARARQVGDLLTVVVDVNDRANVNSTSNRSRKSSADIGTEFDFGLLGLSGQGEGQATADGGSTASGQGSTSRSERLRFDMATVVRRVLPNGHLLVEGSQEILVNNELRKVRISGIVNPRDVSSNNSIAYNRLAEARIVYGGKGQVSDVQKPRWGLQLWDKISPF
jgi:flagellar L-ring protein FlgH